LVQAFYKKHFWDVNRLDQVSNQSIANEMFDTGVNCGIVVAANFLQRSLNLLNRNGKNYPDLIVDGKIGPVTLGVLNRHPSPKNILKCLNGFQFHWYVLICERDKSQEEFFNGWLERVSF
jgi:lysozyme family protein